MGILDHLSPGARKKLFPEPPRPDPQGKNNYLLIILDSCRYDTFLEAQPTNLMKLGTVEKRYSYASWTAPSHFNFMMGLMPHDSPTQVFASDYYKREYLNYNRRLGCEGMEFGKLVPALFLPTHLRKELGYFTHARVSLPVINPATVLNRDFDSYELMDKHNDMAAMVETLEFSEDRPSFYLLNVGETHYPYATPDEDPGEWPRIHGVHGVFRYLDDASRKGGGEDTPGVRFFNQTKLDQLRARQIRAVQYLDREVFPRLLDRVPKNTFVTVTSDHGELFGEDGYFGHGPIQHPKVLEVPFLEAQVR